MNPDYGEPFQHNYDDDGYYVHPTRSRDESLADDDCITSIATYIPLGPDGQSPLVSEGRMAERTVNCLNFLAGVSDATVAPGPQPDLVVLIKAVLRDPDDVAAQAALADCLLERVGCSASAGDGGAGEGGCDYCGQHGPRIRGLCESCLRCDIRPSPVCEFCRKAGPEVRNHLCCSARLEAHFPRETP